MMNAPSSGGLVSGLVMAMEMASAAAYDRRRAWCTWFASSKPEAVLHSSAMDARQKRAAHAAIARKLGGSNRSDVPTTPNGTMPPASSATLSNPKANATRRARFVPKGDR